jgi:hypothetical protein
MQDKNLYLIHDSHSRSVEKFVFSYWFGATALPSDLTKFPLLFQIKKKNNLNPWKYWNKEE